MNILLIYPPKENIITTTLPENINKERGFNPPLGLLYIASVVKNNSSHEVKVLDMQVERLGYGDLGKVLSKIKPDLVGIQTLTFTLVDVIKTASIIKDYSSDIPVVLGGPHVTVYPYESLSLKDVDYVLMGEADFTFLKLVENIQNPDELKKIGGAGFKHNGKAYVNTDFEFIADLDTLPFPDRRMVPYEKYYSLLSRNFPITTMMTSRGCPYRCIYCERLGKKFRAISAKLVCDEIEDCLKLGIKEIFIHDDTFTVDKKRVFDICSEIEERHLKFCWDMRGRVDTVNYELLKAIKKCGCNRVSFGVESGSTEILKNLRKGITLEQVEEAFRMCKELGIEILADFMIGSPGETRAHIEQTIKFAKKLKPDYVQFSVTTPYPGTELYKLAISRGIILSDVWKEFSQLPKVSFVPPLWTEYLSREELLDKLKSSYKRFYLSPWFMFREIFKIRSFRELLVKIRAALQLLRKGGK